MEPVINLFVAIVIILFVAWVILWICRRLGMPGDLYKMVEILVWVIAGASCILRLLRFAGVW